jgi:hypothetical protein
MHVVIKKAPTSSPGKPSSRVCLQKNHKETKKQLLKIYATSSSSSSNNKTKHEEPPLRTAHSLQHSKFKSDHRTIHTRRRKVERRMFPLLFFLFIFVAEGELKYQREKLELENRKPLEKKESKRQTQKLDITKAAEKTSKHATLVGSGTGDSFFFF